jgi:predicted NBD/HSP70 family sugar kinase
VDDFVFLSVGTGMGAGIVLRGELHTGRHGFAGEIDFALDALDEDVDPSAPQVAEIAARVTQGAETSLRAPFEARAVFDAARQGDEAAQLVVDEIARRIALHLAPVAAVVDVELVVLGGGIGSNGDLLLEPVRELLARWLPFPPHVEVSTVGEAAVLAGALAVGVRAALDNVARREVA